jgi:hypothetical protein
MTYTAYIKLYNQQLKLKERHLEQKVFQVRILFTSKDEWEEKSNEQLGGNGWTIANGGREIIPEKDNSVEKRVAKERSPAMINMKQVVRTWTGVRRAVWRKSDERGDI